MPAATPIGIAMSAVRTMTQAEPTNAGKIPANSGFLEGRLTKKFQSSRDNPSIRIEPIKMTSINNPK